MSKYTKFIKETIFLLVIALFVQIPSLVRAADSVVDLEVGKTTFFSWNEIGYSKHQIDSSVWTINDSSVARITESNNRSCVVEGISEGTCTLTNEVATSYTYYDMGVKRNITHTSRNSIVYNINVKKAIPAVSSVTLNQKNIKLKKGKSVQLSYAIDPADSNQTVTFHSSNEKIATVSRTGKVTAKAKGTALVTIKAENDKTDVCKIKVYTVPATSVKLGQKKINMEKGEKNTLTYTFLPSGGESKITWSSSNKNVAAVDGNGMITALNPGTATITAKLPSGKRAVCKVNVSSRISASSIKIEDAPSFVGMGEFIMLKTTVTPSISTDQVEWSSSDNSIAAVNELGALTLAGTGKVTLTAKINGYQDSCEITILPGKWVDLSNGDITITSDSTFLQNYQSDSFHPESGLTIVQSDNTTSPKITIQKDASAKIVLAGITLENYKASPICIEDDSSGHVVIELMKDSFNYLYSNTPCIQKNGDYGSLLIKGEGSLSATTYTESAVIGSNSFHNASNITIESGEITAVNKAWQYNAAAVIGSGLDGSCDNISITGGKIIARGGCKAVGAGNGFLEGYPNVPPSPKYADESNIYVKEGTVERFLY